MLERVSDVLRIVPFQSQRRRLGLPPCYSVVSNAVVVERAHLASDNSVIVIIRVRNCSMFAFSSNICEHLRQQWLRNTIQGDDSPPSHRTHVSNGPLNDPHGEAEKGEGFGD